MLQCVINVSEGRDTDRIAMLAEAAGPALLDVHCDVDHNRSVLTLAGEDVEEATRRLATAVVDTIDIRRHRGVHPRLGALDVVPWVHLVPDGQGRLANGRLEEAAGARDRFARWAAAHLDLPCFLYGPGTASVPPARPAGVLPDEPAPPLETTGPAAPGTERTLPYLRRAAWRGLVPDVGPARPHHRAGAACVGARPLLVAYNLWLTRPDLAAARRVASAIRGPRLRTLGLQVGGEVQVSCNLIDPWAVGPAAAFDAVARRVEVSRAELVGLLPLGVLDAIAPPQWSLLDVDASRTIEARLERAGLDEGRFAYRPPPGR